MNKSLLMLLAVLIAGGLTAFAWMRSGPAAALPATEPEVTGVVTRYEGGRILVEAIPGKQEGNKCWFAISSQTRIFQQQGGGQVRAAAGALAVGQQVQAWSTGPVLESYPCQTGGAAVLILAR